MKIILIDGNNFFIRHFVSNPTLNSNGEPVGAVIGFIRGVKVLIREMRPDRVVVVWDGEGGSERRRSIRNEYKAGRKVRLNREYDSNGGAQEDGNNMQFQFDLTAKYLDLLAISQVRVSGVEADDVIAYLCNFVLDEDVKIVVTADHDMYQLVNERCSMFNPIKKEKIEAKQVLAKHGVLPENYIVVKAICGDASDNISGVHGFGQKTVLKLFPFLAERIVSFEDVFAHATANIDGKPKYKTVVEAKATIVENMELMQLSSPIISASAARSIREQLTSHGSLNVFQAQIELMKDGLQIKDADFVMTFRDHSIRQKSIEEKNG